MPWVSRLYLVERLIAIGAAPVWLAVFALLSIAVVMAALILALAADPRGV